MLRRLLLLLALVSPATGLAQVTVVPVAFNMKDCASGTTRPVTLTWTSSSTAALASGDLYKLFVSTGSISCSTASLGNQFRSDVVAVSLTQTYPGTGGAALYAPEFLAAAGVTCGTTGTLSLNVCVQHIGTASATPKGTAQGTVKYEAVDPVVPVLTAVQPGDGALWVTWKDGTPSTGVDPTSYRVTARDPASGTSVSDVFTSTGTSRLGGLTNGVTYSVTVTAISASGNESAASTALTGTPQLVNGFWEQYVAKGGVEQGGCGGGAAGALSLLGVALALRGLRRRS